MLEWVAASQLAYFYLLLKFSLFTGKVEFHQDDATVFFPFPGV
jgi:hypothetical protein